MPIKVTEVNASDVLTIEALAHGRAGVHFLNWKLSSRPLSERNNHSRATFVGSGLYALCFDNNLIYIGSFLGNEKGIANFSGDVVRSRWWTHIGAITARGNRVHIARTSLAALVLNPGVEHVMVDGFLQAVDPEKLHKDDGNLSPLRRLQFAARHVNDFFANNADPVQILKRFTYVYAQVHKIPMNLSGERLKICIEGAEQRLIQRLAPKCNTTHAPQGMPAIQVNLNEVAEILRGELEQCCV
jgi:hypothetical protein